MAAPQFIELTSNVCPNTLFCCIAHSGQPYGLKTRNILIYIQEYLDPYLNPILLICKLNINNLLMLGFSGIRDYNNRPGVARAVLKTAS